MTKRLISLFLVTSLGMLTFACGEEDKSAEGEGCVEDIDCLDHLVCEMSTCVEPNSRNLYEACVADIQCLNGTCESGYCTRDCLQFYPTSTYSLGDCVGDSDMGVCKENGVGCCFLTAVDNTHSSTQQEVAGFCTTSP